MFVTVLQCNHRFIGQDRTYAVQVACSFVRSKKVNFMDYNLAANRDLVQAEEEKILQVVSTLNSRSPERQRTQEALLVGLKLGSLSHLEEISGQQSQNLGLSVMESPSCGSLKRARAPNNPQVPSCLVDGCNSDLSKCRDYHRRHKVCEPHSKTPKVTIRGQEQRFCQQCSR